MVQNVLSNCFKYGAQRPVLIGVRKRGVGLAIVIYDRGNGIAEEHLPKVFEEFYRVRQCVTRTWKASASGCRSSSVWGS
jgi:signal transduction histidine kinase